MNSITAAALGAGLMYMFDPEQGPARRNQIREKCASLASQSKTELDISLHDLKDRAQGCLTEMRAGVAEHDPAHGITHLRDELTQWTPATRLLAVAGGGALAACVLGAIAPRTMLLAGVGAGICALAMNSQQLQDAMASAMQAVEEQAETGAQSIVGQSDAGDLSTGQTWDEPARAERE